MTVRKARRIRDMGSREGMEKWEREVWPSMNFCQGVWADVRRNMWKSRRTAEMLILGSVTGLLRAYLRCEAGRQGGDLSDEGIEFIDSNN